MMQICRKIRSFALLALLFPIGLKGQKLSRQVTGSTGADQKKGDRQISWMLGEVAVSTTEKAGFILTEGFHQGNLRVTSIRNQEPDQIILKAYPNPVLDKLLVETPHTDITYQIVGVKGTVHLNGILIDKNSVIDLRGLEPGTYFLKTSNLRTHIILKN